MIVIFGDNNGELAWKAKLACE